MIKLRNLKIKDAEGMLEWMHDPEIASCFQKNMSEMTMNNVLAFIEKYGCLAETANTRHYAVVDEKDSYLGTISLKEIDMLHKNAEYAVSLRSIARGKGVAEAATRLLLDIAFKELELERVYLNVLAENTRAVHFYEKFGFREEGTFQKHLFLGGRFVDLKWYGLLRDEYNKLDTKI